METLPSILYQPYKSLKLGVGIKKFMRVHGFETLAELLAHKYSDLLQLKGFNERSLKTLYTFLKEHSLTAYIKQ